MIKTVAAIPPPVTHEFTSIDGRLIRIMGISITLIDGVKMSPLKSPRIAETGDGQFVIYSSNQAPIFISKETAQKAAIHFKNRSATSAFMVVLAIVFGLLILVFLGTCQLSKDEQAKSQSENSFSGILDETKSEAVAEVNEATAPPREGILGVDDEIEKVETKDDETTISLYYKSLWSLKDVYVSTSLAMINIGKYIKAHPTEFGSKIIVKIDTDLTSIDGHDSKGTVAQFHYSKTRLLTPEYDNMVFAQTLNLSNRHNFFTLEAKNSFKEWCDDKSELSMSICNL